MGSWSYNPYKWSYGSLLKTGDFGPPILFLFLHEFYVSKKKYPLNFIAEDKLPPLPMKKVDFRGGGCRVYLFIYVFIYLFFSFIYFFHLFIYLFIFIFLKFIYSIPGDSRTT